MAEVLLRAGEGETISDRAERNLVILVARPEITITWTRYSAGERGPGPHVHREHVDAFYVLDGELTFGLGPDNEPVRAPAGSFVAAPPNVVHSFRNDSEGEARWLNFHAPDKGFSDYLRGAREGRDVDFDSFDPPADGGRPRSDAIVSAPGDGERLGDALIKAALPDLCVVEWSGVIRHAESYYRFGEVTIHAPDDGFAERLRRAAQAA